MVRFVLVALAEAHSDPASGSGGTYMQFWKFLDLCDRGVRIQYQPGHCLLASIASTSSMSLSNARSNYCAQDCQSPPSGFRRGSPILKDRQSAVDAQRRNSRKKRRGCGHTLATDLIVHVEVADRRGPPFVKKSVRHPPLPSILGYPLSKRRLLRFRVA